MVPDNDAKPWPTLGPLVCDWIERNCVFGPGDLLGQPAELDTETRALIYRAYEVHPRGHEHEGRRRFRRAAWSLRKGSAKTEKLGWISFAELDATAPVRCIGWTKRGEPKGGPVTDPYIPLVAYTEEQSDELAYGALRNIIERSPRADAYDVGLERIMRKDGAGKAVSLAAAPSARDGARTTFQGFDETHRFTLANLKKAHRTMMANLPKRLLADPWALEITTAFSPGEQSVAEDTMEYARQVSAGRQKDSKLFFFHRQASDDLAIYDDTGKVIPKALKAAVIEASGPAAEWSDIAGITDQWNDPTADRSFLERVWLNRLVRATDRAFDAEVWRKATRPNHVVEDGATIVLGFDGSRYNDATALVATEVLTGFQWAVGVWERPYVAGPAHERSDWEVPELEVEAAVQGAFERFDVWRMYGDPPNWQTHMAKWSGEYGEEKVGEFRTNLWRKMCGALKSYKLAMQTGELTHGTGPGHPRDHDALTRHIGNSHRLQLRTLDEDRLHEWVIVKERKDSVNKIDAAVAGALSWQARTDALKAGAGQSKTSVYESRGMVAF
jgi:hypothetical protein